MDKPRGLSGMPSHSKADHYTGITTPEFAVLCYLRQHPDVANTYVIKTCSPGCTGCRGKKACAGVNSHTSLGWMLCQTLKAQGADITWYDQLPNGVSADKPKTNEQGAAWIKSFSRRPGARMEQLSKRPEVAPPDHSAVQRKHSHASRALPRVAFPMLIKLAKQKRKRQFTNCGNRVWPLADTALVERQQLTSLVQNQCCCRRCNGRLRLSKASSHQVGACARLHFVCERGCDHYSAQYGQALSSAVILNTSDMPRTSSSGLSLSPIFGGASTQQAWEKTAFAVGGQYTNTYLFNALIPQEIEWTKDFQGLGGNLSFLRKTSQTGLLKVYGTYNASSLGIRYPSPIDSLPGVDFLLDNKNAYINASWKEILNDQWTVLISGAASYNDDAILIQGFDNSRNDYGAQGRIALTNQITEKVKVLGGAEYAYQFYENRFNLFGVDQAFDSQIQEHYGALFLESEFYITNDLAGRAGFRGEYSKALDDYNLAPRLSLAYKTGENSQISFAYGQFYQTPRPQFLGLGEDNLTFERADHYIANWQIVTRDRTFRLEGYYKKYDHLVTQNPIDSLAQNLTYSSNGNGYAGGAEIFYRDKKSIDNGDFWISYSWIDTRRIFLDYPEKVRPDFAAEHLLSLVYKHYFPDISSQVGVTYTFQSGRPYHDPASAAFMDGRTASFNNLSANWSYLTNIGGHFTVFFASVTNILGIDNVFAYRYFDSQGSPLPNYAFNLEAEEYIEVANRPPALRSYFIGMFISFQHTRKPKNLIAPGDAGQQNTAP